MLPMGTARSASDEVGFLMDRLETTQLLHNDVPDGVLKLGTEALFHSAIQQPIDGLTQIVNKVADRELVKSPELFSAPKAVQFGSKEWLAETVGSGLGMVVPFMAVRGLSSRALNGVGALAEKMPLGEKFAQALSLNAAENGAAGRVAELFKGAAPAAKMALDGALYGAFLTPSTDASRNFWEQRGTAAASSALTFGSMGLATKGLMSVAESRFAVPVSDAAFNATLKGIGFRLGVNALSGAAGGFVSAESNSLISGKGFADSEHVMQSMASFMVTGAALDAVHMSSDYLKTSVALANEHAENRALNAAPKLSASDQLMLDKIEKAHFEYFKQESDPETGLTKDRSTEKSAASIAAVGFSLTAHGVAAERGWTSREEAADYTLKVLRTLWNGKQSDAPTGVNGDHGFFYHFLDMKTGERTWNCELSTIDTALLMGGVLYSKNYFDAADHQLSC